MQTVADALVTEVGVAPALAAERLLDMPWAMLLDSSRPGGATGRYSYLTADPFLTIRASGRRVEIGDGAGGWAVDANPWDLVQRTLARYRQPHNPDLPPFQGGLVGYFGYDLGRHLEALPARARPDAGMPDLAIGIYDWVLAHDHLTGRGWLISTGLSPEMSARARRDQVLRRLIDGRPPAGGLPAERPRMRSNVGRRRYLDAVARAKCYIEDGEIYQVNLTHRLEAAWQGEPWALYRRLREGSPVPYAAYLDIGDVAVASASPERFLRLDGEVVETRPIKGTRPRGATLAEDRALAAELAASVKDRAENVMIVDLLRNDLGRVCQVGSVAVPELFAIEGYSNVWQMVSTVTGRLRPGLEAIDLLRASFPGGSITGCPKIRAMQIVEELEPSRRGVYCGAIGYVGFSGAMDTSIVIRTLVLTGGCAHLYVGGAIVADSDPVSEYEETLAKARAGLAALDAELEDW